MILLVDIDRTLSDAEWREHLIPNWDSYHALLNRDKPIREMILLCRMLQSSGGYLIGVTARPEKWRKLTVEWLSKHLLFPDELHMRPDNNVMPSAELKTYIVDNLGIKDEEEIVVIDDNDEVVSAFAALNYTTLQVFARKGTVDDGLRSAEG